MTLSLTINKEQKLLIETVNEFINLKMELQRNNFLNKAISSKNNINLLINLAISYAHSNKLTESLILFKYLEKKIKDDIRIPYNLGLIYSIQENQIEAIKYYDLALDIKSNDVETLINKGLAYLKIEKPEQALKSLEISLRINKSIPQAWSNKGIALRKLKNYNAAVIAYNQALSLKPDYVEAWLNKGVSLHELKDYDAAIECYQKALSLKPDYVEAYFNQGNTLNELKDYDAAIECYQKALSLKPDYAEAWSNKGLTLHELKDYDAAIECYQKALSLKPDYAEAWSNESVSLHKLRRNHEAVYACDQALTLKPDYAEAWSNKGVSLHELKDYDAAIECYQKALSLKPDYAEAWSNKGLTLHELKDYDAAIECYQKALSLKPDYAEAWTNIGTSYRELRKYAMAATGYKNSLLINQNYVEAYFHQGIYFYQLKDYDAAIECYQKALSLKPDYAEAWSNKGVSLHELKDYDAAIECYQKALSLKPDIDWVFGDLFHLKMKICLWDSTISDMNNITQKVSSGHRVISPFPALAMSDDPILHRRCAGLYSATCFPENHSLGPILKTVKHNKIRIGYFSADFREHAVSYLSAELFELHSRNHFEIIAFSYGVDDHSPMRNRLCQAFDRFIDVSEWTDKEIAQHARYLGVDIAIDLGGYTKDARMGIFAYRAAPIQISYLGYPGTVGANYIDYIVADNTVIDTEQAQQYSEKIIYLPCYQVNDRQRQIPTRQFTRQELGLPERGFVFACFNNNYKILPDTFNSWMRILKAVEGSVLWLYGDSNSAKLNLIIQAKLNGINSERIIFGKRTNRDEYIARYRECDLFLDTFPYNAGTTASDALWAGLPVLTLMGKSFASRMAASLLTAINLPELITTSQSEYEKLAIKLATQPEQLIVLKQKLLENRLTTHLFDTPKFTLYLENAYCRIYERYHAKFGVDNIIV